jgi:hypothetical protein
MYYYDNEKASTLKGLGWAWNVSRGSEINESIHNFMREPLDTCHLNSPRQDGEDNLKWILGMHLMIEITLLNPSNGFSGGANLCFRVEPSGSNTRGSK